jgi:hypothetical protein
MDASSDKPYKYYVYSFVSQEFASVISNEFAIVDKDTTTYRGVETVVAGYPSSVIQIGDTLYTPMETDRNGLQNGLLLSRPITLDEPFALKKLVDMRLHYSKFVDNFPSRCRVIVYVSNDGVKWHILTSMRKRSFKYYRIAVISQMADADALTGCIVRYELERTNKIR